MAHALKAEANFLTVGQLAGMIGVSPKTVVRWAKAGRMPIPVHYTLGGHRRFDRADVEPWLATLKEGAAG